MMKEILIRSVESEFWIVLFLLQIENTEITRHHQRAHFAELTSSLKQIKRCLGTYKVCKSVW